MANIGLLILLFIEMKMKELKKVEKKIFRFWQNVIFLIFFLT